MARTRVRSRAAGDLALDVEVEGLEKTTREFRAIRQRIARQLRDVEARAAETTVLPDAKRNASRLKVDGDQVSGRLVIRRSAKGPYLTTSFRGIRARAAGLQEFGGTVRTPIVPKRKKALLVNGQPVAIVRKARHYRARHHLTDAAHEQLGQFGEHVRDEIVTYFSGLE